MITVFKSIKNKITTEHIFMLSVLFVNGGNYIYNLILGRFLGPEKFADAAILITLLLVLSFMAMTFQLVTTKFSVLFTKEVFKRFIVVIYKQAIIVGVFLSILIVVFASALQSFFNTSSSNMFVVFGLGVPFYFLMSVNRGIYQGENKLICLSITYQLEMVSRLLITFFLLLFYNISSSLIIAIGIFCSFIIGLIPFKGNVFLFTKVKKLTLTNKNKVRSFFLITAFYEVTQIVVNNSDILLVKHYFDNYNAGLYASLALIGRVVYFIAWMFVMLLLPKVIKLHKEGRNTISVLIKNVSYIGGIAAIIILSCYCFPKEIVVVLFGNDYLAIASLLWKYALATGLFAVSNIFAYYYLSLDNYMPVILSGLFGLLQMLLVILFHSSLTEVVEMQIITMFILLLMQLSFFFFKR